MKKQNERSPDEVAKDLETLDFAEISHEDLREIFSGSGIEEPIGTNCNCWC